MAEGAASGKPMERAGGRAHIYVLIETMINCTTEGLTVTVFLSRPATSHSLLLQSVFFRNVCPKLAPFLLIFQLMFLIIEDVITTLLLINYCVTVLL